MPPKSKTWTEEDDRYLRDNYHTQTNQELGDHFGIGRYAIKYRAKVLKLKRVKSYEKVNVGDSFTDLTICDKESERGGWYVKCRCVCGNIVDATVESLLSGKVKGCGCNTWRVKLNPPGMVSYRKSYRTYTKNAQKCGREFSLILEEFIHIIIQDCFYCDGKPKLFNAYFNSEGELHEHYKNKDSVSVNSANVYTNGVDRIDNSRGYLLDNCVPCCWDCNQMKGGKSIYIWCAIIERFQPRFTVKVLEKLDKLNIKMPPKENLTFTRRDSRIKHRKVT
jgi:hypothetical protein